MDSINTELLRGRVDIFVLNSLSERDGYGYDILNYIQARTEGHYEMKQSSVYSVLKRLEKNELISSYWGGDETNGAQRRYYSLTDKGREVLDADKKEWAYTRTLLNNLVSDKEFDLKSDAPPFRASDLRPLTKRGSSGRNDDSACDEDNSSIVTGAAVACEEKIEPQTAFNEPSVVCEVEDPKIGQLSLPDFSLDEEPAKYFEPNCTAQPAAIENEVAATVYAADVSGSVSAAEMPQRTIKDVFDEARAKAAYSAINYETRNNAGENRAISDVFASYQVESGHSVITDKPDSQRKSINDAFSPFLGKTENKNSSSENYERAAHFAANTYAPSVDEPDFSEFVKIREKLKTEGFKIADYDSAKTKDGSLRYLLVNKLLRDSSILTFLFYFASILLAFLLRKAFDYSFVAFIISALVGALIPAVMTLIYVKDPYRRQKESAKPKLLFNICIIAFLAFFMFNLVIALLAPNGKSLNTASIYLPSIYALSIPFFGIIFNVLYKTDNYQIGYAKDKKN